MRKGVNPFKFTNEQMVVYIKWQLHFSDISNIIFMILSLYLIFITPFNISNADNNKIER